MVEGADCAPSRKLTGSLKNIWFIQQRHHEWPILFEGISVDDD
jgi:hypothetical protein